MIYETIETPELTPPLWLRSSSAQTFLASSKLRLPKNNWFENTTQKIVLTLSDQLRTSCYFNAHAAPKGMIVLLHGWLGTPQSAYVASAAQALFDNGYSVARLTLQEHGDAVGLNSTIVPITHPTFLHEAVGQICALKPSLPLGVMGFSLGGNCALRIARDCTLGSLPQLRSVFAISPVIKPADACDKTDQTVLIRRYFLRKFRRLYREKQLRHPNLMDWETALSQKTLRGITEKSMPNQPEFRTVEDFFAAYQIGLDDFVSCPVKVTLLTALDDPIVSPIPAQKLSPGPNFEKVFTRFGGHNGFFNSSLRSTFGETLAVKHFDENLFN